MATIIVFASSLFLTIILLLAKAIELKSGKRNFVLNLLGRLDNSSAKLVFALKFRCLQIIQSVRYIMLVQSREFISDLLRRAEEKMAREYRIRQSAIMGQKQIANNGSVSFYLKKITEHKGNGTKGKIEESL